MKSISFNLRSLKTKITLFTLAIFLFGIWSLAFYASGMMYEDMRYLLGAQQLSTVSYIAQQVNQELEDRLKALKTISKNISPAILADQAALQKLLEERPILRSLFNGGLTACRLDGVVAADVPVSMGRMGINYLERDHVAAALNEGKAMIGRPVMGKQLKAPVLGMSVPIRDEQDKVIGALSGITDLGRPNFLDKLTDSHYGKTGGYVLLIPGDRLIVTATEKNRIMEPLPAAGINPPLDRFLNGYEGSVVYTNPLGVHVLGSAKKVPVAGWLLGVTLPTKEAFAPIQDMQRHVLLTTICMTLLVGVLTWWVLRRLLLPISVASTTLATMSTAGQALRPLPITGQDEISELIGSFNRLLETLGQREKALRESGKRHQAILETAMDGFWQTDRLGRILEVNETYCRMSGYSALELQTMRICDLSSVNTKDAIDDNMRKIIAQGEDRFETRHRRKDGSIFDVEFSAQYRPDEGGRLVVFLRDISPVKQAEEGRRIAEEKYRSIFENASEGIFQTSEEGRILTANPALARMFGYDSPEVFMQTIKNIGKEIYVNEEDRLSCRRILNESGTVQNYEAEMFRKDGSVAWISITAKKVCDHCNMPLYYEGFVEEITDRKIAEKVLRESEEFARRVIESSKDCIKVLDLNGYILSMSASGQKLLEIDDIEKYLNISWVDFWDGLDREAALEVIAKAKQGDTGTFRGYCKTAKGTPKWWEVTASPIKDSQGNCERLLVVSRDITESKRIGDVQAFLAQISTGTMGETFFDALARYLSEILEMDFVCIDRLEGDGLTATTVAVWCDGKFDDNVSYALKDTPGGDVVGALACCIPSGVRQLYPKDKVLEDLRAESYVGTTLFDHTGKPIGLIAVIGRGPMTNGPLAEATLKMVSVRAAGELERLDAETALDRERSRAQSYLDTVETMIVALDPEGRISSINRKGCLLFGCREDELVGQFWFSACLPQPDGMEKVYPYFLKIMAGAEDLKYNENPIVVRGGELRYIAWNNSLLRDKRGRIVGILSSGQDITDRKVAVEALKNSLAEKEILLKEVHHRVKNNLAAIIGLVEMQGETMVDERARAATIELRERIRSMSLVHEKLYQSDNFARIDFQNYLEELIEHLRSSYCRTGDIRVTVVAKGVEMGLDFAIPCGLFITELVTNAFKYAFPAGRPCPGAVRCEVDVSVGWDGVAYTLVVADNGVGLPANLDWKSTKTLGLMLVGMLGQHQLQGKIDVDRTDGTRFRLRFAPNNI